MNRNIKILALSLVSTLGLCAGAMALGPVAVTAKADFASKYVWRGYDLNANGPAIQPSITASYAPVSPLTLSLGVWSSYDVTTTKDWTEFDYTLSGSYAVSDTVSVSAGYIFYAFPVVADSDLNDTKELYVGASFVLPADLTAAVTAYYDHDDGKGLYLNCALDYITKVGEKASLDLGASAGYMSYDNKSVYKDSDGKGMKGLSDFNFKAALSTPITDALSLGLTANYTIAADDGINADNEFWTLSSLSYAF